MNIARHFLARRRAASRLKGERRLHQRAVLYWAEASGDDGLLPLTRLDAAALEDWLTHGFLLDLASPEAPRLVRVGPVLAEEAGLDDHEVDGAPVPLASVDPASLLARFAAFYKQAVETRAPVKAEYDFTTSAGYRVLCRGALLPVTADGATADHVYGVVSWKSERVSG